MKASERRKAIIEALLEKKTAVNGTELAQRFGVSRQIIVSDISALKAEGNDIQSTHNGYVMIRADVVDKVFKVRHTKDQTEDELETIISLGGTVDNVYVWHKVYGRIEASLGISTHGQIERFMEGVRSGKSTELMNITGGYHYHRVYAESKEALDRIEQALIDKGYTVPEV